MTIRFASNINSIPSRRELSARDEVEADDFDDINQALNLIWAHSGARLGGAVYDGGKSITASTALTEQTQANVCDRKIASDNIKIRGWLYAVDASLSIAAVNASTGTTIGTITLDEVSTAQWVDAAITVTYASTTDDGTSSGTPALLYCEPTANTTQTSGTIYGWAVAEDITDSSSEMRTG